MDFILPLILATTVLVAIPGPNVALIVANTLRRGFRFGTVTVLGTTAGIAVQLSIVLVGLSVVLEVAAAAMAWIKWLGVAYLIYLGIQSWRRDSTDLAEVSPSAQPAGFLFWQGLILATINPKTLLFNAAFLPQFLDSGSGRNELLLAAGVYLTVLLLGDLLWAAFAGVARPVISRFATIRDRITGCIFVGSGVGLGLARIEP